MASLHPGLMTAVWRPRAPGGPAYKYLLGRHLLAGLATLATLARLRAGPRIPAHARHSCECVASPHPASTIYCPLCTPERVNTGAGDCWCICNDINICNFVYLIVPRIDTIYSIPEEATWLGNQDISNNYLLLSLSLYILYLRTVYYLWMEENVEQCGPYIVTIRPDQTRYYLLGQHVGGLKHEGLKG